MRKISCLFNHVLSFIRYLSRQTSSESVLCDLECVLS